MEPSDKGDVPPETTTPASSDPWAEWWQPGVGEAPPEGPGTPIVVPTTPPPATPGGGGGSAEPPPPSKRSMGKLVGVGAASLALVAGVIFAVHAATSHSGTAAATNGGTNGNRNGPGGRGATSGTLASVHGSVLTVTTTSGKKVTVNTSGSTRVTRSAAGTMADVKVGDRVTVRGTSSATNAVAAEQIGDTGPASQAPAG
ncbi:MAG: hypothetical protein M3137_09020, partial [Actinomycetota bacterium]|nr:hypothetical protein [Actinomycetota bacterium]